MDLLERFAHGDLDAFETLVHQSQSEIYGWIMRIVRDRGVAENLTVEALWRIYRARHHFQMAGNFQAWSRRIATNLAIDHLRRKRPEESLEHEPAAASVPDHLLQSEQREQIHREFQRLPANLRVAAMLALVEERSHREIADALGISVGAVKLRVFRAVRLLRKRLRQHGIRPE